MDNYSCYLKASEREMQKIVEELEQNNSVILSHVEILEMIKEIKKFEHRFKEFEIEEIKPEEFVDIEPETWIPIESTIDKQDKEESILSKLKRNKMFRIRFSLKPKNIKQKSPKPAATFKLRLNNKGNLVNIDFNEPKPKEERKVYQIISKIPDIKSKITKKGKKSKKSEKKSKKFSFKDKLSKVSKLKKAIPSKKSKKNEESEGGSE
jgi:hypothetical protein